MVIIYIASNIYLRQIEANLKKKKKKWMKAAVHDCIFCNPIFSGGRGRGILV
jgi:hypothetical protein